MTTRKWFLLLHSIRFKNAPTIHFLKQTFCISRQFSAVLGFILGFIALVTQTLDISVTKPINQMKWFLFSSQQWPFYVIKVLRFGSNFCSDFHSLILHSAVFSLFRRCITTFSIYFNKLFSIPTIFQKPENQQSVKKILIFPFKSNIIKQCDMEWASSILFDFSHTVFLLVA